MEDPIIMQDTQSTQPKAERLIVGFIITAASISVGLITAYLVMFDARGMF